MAVRDSVVKACIKVAEELRAEGGWIPYDTGNMRYNSLCYVETNDRVIIYMDKSIAPYVPYTNEPWTNRKGTNPNEGWWERFVEEFVRRLATELGGEVKW